MFIRLASISAILTLWSLSPRARAFSFTTGNPTQCDDLSLSWTGKHNAVFFRINGLTGYRWYATIPIDAHSGRSWADLITTDVEVHYRYLERLVTYLYHPPHLAMERVYFRFNFLSSKAPNFSSPCPTLRALELVVRLMYWLRVHLWVEYVIHETQVSIFLTLPTPFLIPPGVDFPFELNLALQQCRLVP